MWGRGVHLKFLEFDCIKLFITSLANEVMVLVALVCLSVCYSTSYERIRMKFYGGVLGGTRKNPVNFGDDLAVA